MALLCIVNPMSDNLFVTIKSQVHDMLLKSELLLKIGTKRR